MSRRQLGIASIAAVAVFTVLMAVPNVGALGAQFNVAVAPVVKGGGLDEAGQALPMASDLRSSAVSGHGAFLGEVNLAAAADGVATAVGTAGEPSSPRGSVGISAATSKPDVVHKFVGLGFNAADLYPADPAIAANKTAVVEVVNSELEVTSTTGVLISGPLSLQTFFGTASTDEVAFPQAFFDQNGDRFLVTALDYTTNVLYWAVSTTASATGGWYLFEFVQGFSGPANAMTTPVFGYSSTELGFSTNQYNTTTDGIIGTIATVLDWSDMKKGEIPSGSWEVGVIYSTVDWYIFPAISVTGNGTGTSVLYWAETNDFEDATALYVWGTTGEPSSVSYVSAETYAIADAGAPPSAKEANGGPAILTGYNQVGSASWAQYLGTGYLWVSFESSCVPKGDKTARSCIRVDGVDTSTNTLLQDTNTAVAGLYLYMGALAALPGGAQYLMVLDFSGPLNFPGVAISGQSVKNGYGTFEAPVLVYNSPSASEFSYYGSYAGAAWDPASSTSHPLAWGVEETSPSGSPWGTEVVHFKF